MFGLWSFGTVIVVYIAYMFNPLIFIVMKQFSELTKEQRLILKERLVCESCKAASYDDVVDADNIISDEELEKVYGGTMFSEEDF